MKRTALADLPAKFDLIIIGGGVTGAGILREAVKSGFHTLLVEQNDFASGTSSRSSKLVHGGLRYLKTGQWRLTLESVRERDRLLDEAPALVQRQTFLMPIYKGRKPSAFTMRAGLRIYDWMSRVRSSRWLDAAQLEKTEPQLRRQDLLGAVAYEDAQTDDAGLVIRLIADAVANGGTALNYTRVVNLLSADGRVAGVALQDADSDAQREIRSTVVLNAAGAGAAQIPGMPAAPVPLRPLRGSHLLFPLNALPISSAVSWLHPRDGRPVFAYPWQGAILYGTTDLDHSGSLWNPAITRTEGEYLLEGLQTVFAQPPGRSQVTATCAGVRPVVSSGKADPSAESRESALWSTPGMVSIAGGKLTTFRVIARKMLEEALRQGLKGHMAADLRVFQSPPSAGAADLRARVRHEQVRHLDDLLLRRTRIGLTAADGGMSCLAELAQLCADELGWDPPRQHTEIARYREIWRQQHSPELIA